LGTRLSSGERQRREPIENDHYALVSCNDERAMLIRRQHKEFDGLVSKFTDEFGVQLAPAILMIRAGSGPEVLNIEAVAGFRDAIALAFVCKSRALRMIYRHARPLQFSSWFDFYPWITSVPYSAIIGTSPAFQGWHETETFRGQNTAGLPHAELRTMDCDEPLLKALLGEWTRRAIRMLGVGSHCSGR
jgi:hypothetical protein